MLIPRIRQLICCFKIPQEWKKFQELAYKTPPYPRAMYKHNRDNKSFGTSLDR